MASLYFDADFSRGVADLLQGAGHTVLTAYAAGLLSAKDDIQLLTAAQRGFALVTHNIKDFRLLHDAWLNWSNAWDVPFQHAGILILPQPTPSERAYGRMDDTHIAEIIQALLITNAPAPNELWQWRRDIGWTRQ
jgi:hypothetical protein